MSSSKRNKYNKDDNLKSHYPQQQQQQIQISNQRLHKAWTPFIGPRSFKRNIEEKKLFFGRAYERSE